MQIKAVYKQPGKYAEREGETRGNECKSKNVETVLFFLCLRMAVGGGRTVILLCIFFPTDDIVLLLSLFFLISHFFYFHCVATECLRLLPNGTSII